MKYYGEDYLAHFGVKGQKWGIRRFQNPDGTLTEAGKKHYGVADQEFKSQAEKDIAQLKFAKKVAKETTKLGKRVAKADVKLQGQLAEKYDKNANTAAKVGIAALGAAAAAAGSHVVADKAYQNMRNNLEYKERNLRDAKKTIEKLLPASYRSGEFPDKKGAITEADIDYGTAKRAGYSADSIANQREKLFDAHQLMNDVRGATFVAGSAVGIAAAGVAGYNALKSLAAKKRMTDIGHAKAVERMNKQYNKVVNMVKDTPYKSVLDARVEAYKQEHPGTELSDKQIMKNLM